MADTNETTRLNGRRISDGEFFQHSEPEPGDYGRMYVEGEGFRWFVCLPNGVQGVLDPGHFVNENADGTISVSPSIENKGRLLIGDPLSGGAPISDPHSYWHGHLVDGEWISARA